MEQVVVHLINSYDKFTQFGNLSVLKYSTELVISEPRGGTFNGESILFTRYMYKSTMNADNSSLLFTQIYNPAEKL